ncbi:hypothetical protein pipiens_018237 [Culex pipiens pipiens]|uniref:Aspartate/ornithine carbamoyltransferase carbamoyl-P binding domain-containing protein n=1 Tax=Culex pipiens pipiens TaxID=38569 RepID=A0ABD1CCZ0_CULPP
MILPLLLTTFNEDRLSLEDLIAMFYKNPKWNFGLPEQPNTYGEDDFNEEWIITEVPPHYKARWSSFAGIKVKGRVYRSHSEGANAGWQARAQREAAQRDLQRCAQDASFYYERSPLDDLLRGKIMASVFYEVSARTSCSVTGAMQCLGGRVIYMDETSSSIKKARSSRTASS